MRTSDQTILAVGAAGKFAGLVVPALAARGAHVRGLVRDAKQGDAVLKSGAREVAVGDLADRASLDAALRGVHSVFYIAPAFLPDEANVGRSVVEAAKEAGARRFVFSSVIDPTLGALVNHAAKAPVEEAVLESGMEFTLLHPALFFQGLAAGWAAVEKTGAFAQPWSAETRFAWVDYRDVAEAAALALTGDRLLYGTFELCAEGSLNRHDLAALMGEALGREVKATRADPPPGDGPQAAGLAAMFAWYDHHGLPGNALTLRAVLGREPRTLRQYLGELAAGQAPAQ